MSGAVLTTKLARSERMCPTDTQQHTQRQSADPTGIRHRGSTEEQEGHKNRNMAHRQTAKCCALRHDTMDRNILGMITGREKKRPKDGGGGTEQLQSSCDLVCGEGCTRERWKKEEPRPKLTKRVCAMRIYENPNLHGENKNPTYG